MRVLFITIGAVYDFNNSGAYTDLLKRFKNEGHEVYVVGAIEKRNGQETNISTEYGIKVLRVKVGNITKTNLIEKGISTLTIGILYEKAIKRNWGETKFDLILYTTPPITIANLVKKLKRKYNAFTYLLLKDIFPQNAVDIGILSKFGIKGFIYLYFRNTEKKLYKISDKIGCMSIANLNYVIENNAYLNRNKLEVCPNTIDVISNIRDVGRTEILEKYGIPLDKEILVYGGNFGKPQNVPYVIASLRECKNVSRAHFVLCGSGTDFDLIEHFVDAEHPSNVTVIKQLPYSDYSTLLSACTFGLLFLDYRFTIPNFPSRLLDYMNFGLPVVAATDVNTDVGETIVKGGFGWWIESRDPKEFKCMIENIMNSNNLRETVEIKSGNARKCLINEFETSVAFNTIMKSYNNDGRE